MSIDTKEAVMAQTQIELVQSDVHGFVAAVKAAALGAGRDTTLPTLTAIHVKLEGRTLTIESTDRYRAHRIVWQADDKLRTHDNNDLPSFDLLFPAKELQAAVKLVDRKTFGAIVTVEGDTLTVNNYSSTSSVRALDGEFPKLGKIYRDRTGESSANPLTVNPSQLIDAAKAVTLMGDKRTPIVFELDRSEHGKNKPALFYPSSNGYDGWVFNGMIMPVRMS